MAEVRRSGGRLDPDVLYRSLPYLVDPDWTKGHAFAVRYVVTGEGGGTWYVTVRDGEPLAVTREVPRAPSGTATVSFDSYQRLASGEISPSIAMQNQLTTIDGELYPITLLGRWIARAQGLDDAELKREAKQRELQEERAGLYASGGDHDGDGLLDYRQLYALWERQNWKATELDFSVDREQWVVTPREAQESTIWSLGSFYVGEERVTADLAPFLQAAPTGEIELFLATQLVDEARHAAFFDRFGAEVMCLSADDFRGRMREVEQILLSPWREVFDDGLRDVAKRIQAKPDDLDLFVEGITDLPHGGRGLPGRDRPDADPRLHGRALDVPRLLRGLRARRARRAPPRGLRRALPARRDPRGRRATARRSSAWCSSSRRRRPTCSRRRTSTDASRVRLVRLHVAADLRLRLPHAEAAHEGARASRSRRRRS